MINCELKLRNYIAIAIIFLITGSQVIAQRQMENLDRGVIAIHKGNDSVYIGWRMLGTEPDEITFNIYRQNGNEKPVRLNKNPIKESTNYEDGNVNFKTDISYFVKAVLKGKEQEKSKSFILKAGAPVQQYINIPLRTPAGYTPNDVSVGDLDGDGEYELILHQAGRGIDTPSTGISGYYGRSVLAAWDWRDGKLTSRWVFDSKDGENPYSGQGNHNISVSDVDGDGKDEIIYGSMVVDDNGKGLFSTGFRHGDAIHVGALDPGRQGLQVFGIHEIESGTTGPGVSVYDAGTGMKKAPKPNIMVLPLQVHRK